MLRVRADGFVARQHQHQFAVMAQFILSYPMFYKTKLINPAFIKFCRRIFIVFRVSP